MATILVVDDEAEVATIVTEYLTDIGYTVLQADRCKAALAMLREHACDVLVSDIRMPCQSGTELAAEAVKQQPTLKVLLMTGYATNGHVWPVLRKPFRMVRLRQAIETALGKG